MDKYIEVIHNILPLLQTMEEGIEHTKKQTSELRYEEAFIILQDVVAGIMSIEEALKPLEVQVRELQDKDIKQTKMDLNHFISQAVTSYEQKDFEEFRKALSLVLGAFIVWKSCIEDIIKPNTLS